MMSQNFSIFKPPTPLSKILVAPLIQFYFRKKFAVLAEIFEKMSISFWAFFKYLGNEGEL